MAAKMSRVWALFRRYKTRFLNYLKKLFFFLSLEFVLAENPKLSFSLEIFLD
jgi:hypothetical protein